jgi:hypothetical protein
LADINIPIRDRLIAALEVSDGRRREERADRIIWLSKHQMSVGLTLEERIELPALLEEARHCYVEGLYISSAVVATAFIEQTIVSELLEKGYTTRHRIPYSEAVELAKSKQLFDGLLERAAAVGGKRNAYAHYKEVTDCDSFTWRFVKGGKHPQAIREEDAQEALSLMEAFYRASLAARAVEPTLNAASGSSAS